MKFDQKEREREKGFTTLSLREKSPVFVDFILYYLKLVLQICPFVEKSRTNSSSNFLPGG